MTDQIYFLPMLEPRDTSFEDNERKASQICDEEFERADGDMKHCIQELAQCGAVIIRMMQFVLDEMEE